MRIVPTLGAQLRQPGQIGKPARPTFAGQQEYDAFKKRLDQFPSKSVENMAHIKREEAAEAPKHDKHVKLAISLGKVDQHIEWLNAQILRLIGERRNGKGLSKQSRNDIISAAAPQKTPEAVQASAKEFLSDLRQAQDDLLVQRGYTTQGEKNP